MLPKDPMILLSLVNTKLRDEFSSLEALCRQYDVAPEELQETLSQVGFVYDRAQNQFK